jgi:hypothetical protein
MAKRKETVGASSVVKRRQLKSGKQMTDEELLEDAMRQALKWKASGYGYGYR